MRIALIGDSHSQALWPRIRTGLEAAGHTVVLSEANAGWSEATYLSKGNLAAKVQAARPDLVVYELGGNNMKMTDADYKGDPTALVSLAKDVGAAVLWFGPPVSDAIRAASTATRHETTSNMQKLILPALGVTWVDSRPFTANSPNHQKDGVHFDSTGYTNWARAMLPSILSAPEKLGTGMLWLALGGATAVSALIIYLVKNKRRK